MAKSGTPRHSKTPAASVTIDLDPREVRLVPDETTDEDLEAEEIQAEPADAVRASEDAQTDSAPQPIVQNRRGSSLTGGLIGGGLALLGGAGLQWAGVLPSFQGNSEIAALRLEVASLAERPGAPAIDPDVITGLAAAQAGLQKHAEAFDAELTLVEDSQRKIVQEFAALKSGSGAAAGDPAAMAAVTEKLAALESGISALKSADASPRLAELETRLASLQQSAGSAAGASNVAQAIAAAGLKAAIDRGGSFASELETYATVVPSSPELEQLKNLAASGVPSKAELTAAFGSAADRMIAATQVSDPDAGLLKRLSDSARSLVRSRRVGAVEGDAPEAVIARMEVAVNRGDIDTALTEANKLPDAARAAGIDYIGQLTARRDTDALVSKALTSALTNGGTAQ
jgi:hypothetical protein